MSAEKQADIHVGSQIRAERKRLGLTQTATAALTNIRQSNLSRIERSAGRPDVKTLIRLKRAGMSIGRIIPELVGREKVICRLPAPIPKKRIIPDLPGPADAHYGGQIRDERSIERIIPDLPGPADIHYGSQIRDERSRLGLTQTAAAALMGITRSGLCYIEHSPGWPSAKASMNLKRVGISIERIIPDLPGPANIHVGSQIRAERKRLGLTQTAAAALMGITQSGLSQIERSPGWPSFKASMNLKRAGISIERIIPDLPGPANIHYGSQIRDERSRLGLTKTAAAALMGITRSGLRQIERSAGWPSFKASMNLKRAGISIIQDLAGPGEAGLD